MSGELRRAYRATKDRHKSAKQHQNNGEQGLRLLTVLYKKIICGFSETVTFLRNDRDGSVGQLQTCGDKPGPDSLPNIPEISSSKCHLYGRLLSAPAICFEVCFIHKPGHMRGYSVHPAVVFNRFNVNVA